MWDTGTSSADNMLTTAGSTQYLHPDYLQPLPTTLDAKKSPLALLAQTCSSIGKDSTPAKSLIPPIEKKDKDKEGHRSSSRSKSESPGARGSPSQDRSLSQPSAGEKREGGSSPSKSHSRATESPKSGFRAPVPKEASSSSAGRSSKSPSASSPSLLSKVAGDRESTSTTSVIQHPTPSTSASQSNSRISINCGNMMLEVNHNESQSSKSLQAGGHPGQHSAGAASHPLAGSLRHDPTAAALHHSGLHHHLGAAYPGVHLPGVLGHPMDAMHASSAYAAAALSAHSSLLKPGSLGVPNSAALSSYMGYARVKTPTGASTLVPVCKDPYCTHCQSTVQTTQLGGSVSASACTAGCTQCTHDKTHHIPSSLSSAHTAALGGLPLFNSALGATAPGMSSLALSSLYPHAALGALPAHPGLPYVCNWMSGSDYCGKRFTTSEELLQHLRTHTSDSQALAAAALPYASLGLSAYQSHLHAAATAATHGGGSLSPNSALRAQYPRSLSPSSLLAASRFHPYKSALSSLSSPPGAPTGLPVSLPSALGPHYPYTLYGQRLGAAVTP